MQTIQIGTDGTFYTESDSQTLFLQLLSVTAKHNVLVHWVPSPYAYGEASQAGMSSLKGSNRCSDVRNCFYSLRQMTSTAPCLNTTFCLSVATCRGGKDTGHIWEKLTVVVY